MNQGSYSLVLAGVYTTSGDNIIQGEKGLLLITIQLHSPKTPARRHAKNDKNQSIPVVIANANAAIKTPP
jgi:hypothetical protein